jgi:hypothetical protein
MVVGQRKSNKTINVKGYKGNLTAVEFFTILTLLSLWFVFILKL